MRNLLLLLGLGVFACFCLACNDDVSSATSDIVVDSSSSVAPIPVEESSSVGSSSSMEPNSVAASSSSEYSSSVSADTVAASSSSVESSSSFALESSSGKTVNRTFLWDGNIDTEGQVETGSPDETAGYWYDFSDRNVGGSSKFIFPSDVEEREDGNFYGPFVEYYMGIRASVSFGDEYDPPYQPYAGFGFNVWSEDQEGVDVSEWGGICIAYQSTIPFVIELGVEDEATLTEYVNYRASVSASSPIIAVDFPWSKFKTGVWGPVASIEDVLKKVAAIKLKFEGEAGTTGDFLIQKIGSLGQCEGLGLL